MAVPLYCPIQLQVNYAELFRECGKIIKGIGTMNRNKEYIYFLMIFILVSVYLIISFIIPEEIITKRLTTVIAIISAVAFWLQFKRAERLNESNFIMNLNNQFIGNEDMTMIEHELELYYNQYEVLFGNEDAISYDNVSKVYLGINLSRTSEDCQKMINYLVYLEALASMIESHVLHISVIDDLFSYRFFLAVNNPVIQENELFPYADFYQGVYKLSERWIKDHEKRGISIPMRAFCLTRLRREENKTNHNGIKLDISFARGSDSKAEIAGCLYETDMFIYPEAFGEDKAEATKAISRIIGMDGSLFDYKNFYVARYNGQICGICLISDGTGQWDISRIKRRIGNDLMPLRQEAGFEYASKKYFQSFCGGVTKASEIEIVACAVDEGFRRKHIADAMLHSLEDYYSNKDIRLSVLRDNASAIELYKKHGFKQEGEKYPGFAPMGLQRPDVINMVKQARG